MKEVWEQYQCPSVTPNAAAAPSHLACKTSWCWETALPMRKSASPGVRCFWMPGGRKVILFETNVPAAWMGGTGGWPRFLAIKSEGECRTEGLLTHFFIFRPLYAVGFNAKKNDTDLPIKDFSIPSECNHYENEVPLPHGSFFISQESGSDIKGTMIFHLEIKSVYKAKNSFVTIWGWGDTRSRCSYLTFWQIRIFNVW